MNDFILQYNNMKVVRFHLKKGDSIPLHLHEGQNAFAYLLEGKCALVTYCILSNEGNAVELELSSEQVVEAHSYCTLTPSLNAHEITALEDCVFLDCFAPSVQDGCLSDFLTITETNGQRVKAVKIPPEDVQLPDYWYSHETPVQEVK